MIRLGLGVTAVGGGMIQASQIFAQLNNLKQRSLKAVRAGWDISRDG